MTIVCFISGSGTNYREIVKKNPKHHYIVFTNRPGCAGVAIARDNKHEVIELSHLPYLREAKERYGAGNMPRNCPERVAYEREVSSLIESQTGGEPDVICLAGYDQWLTDWTVDRYYPRIINVHPGDTTRGYYGLHWIPSARAILAGDDTLRATLFIVDKGEDTGPVLVQSRPLIISDTVMKMVVAGTEGLVEAFERVTGFTQSRSIKTYEDFTTEASEELRGMLEKVCKNLQEALKMAGDWEIYPFAVHDLLARGRVAVADRKVHVDGKELPEYGYRLEEHA